MFPAPPVLGTRGPGSGSQAAVVPALRGCRHDKTEPLKEAITTQCDGTTGSEFKALEAWRRVPEPSLEHGEGCETRESRGGGAVGQAPRGYLVTAGVRGSLSPSLAAANIRGLTGSSTVLRLSIDELTSFSPNPMQRIPSRGELRRRAAPPCAQGHLQSGGAGTRAREAVVSPPRATS